MTGQKDRSLAVLASLWLRLCTVFLVAVLFFLPLLLPSRITKWRFYLSTEEVVFEVAVLVVSLAWAGLALGTLATLLTAPIALAKRRSGGDPSRTIIRCAVGLAAFVDLGIGLAAMLRMRPMRLPVQLGIIAAYCVAYLAVMLSRRHREPVVTSLDGMLEPKASRRALLTTGIASAALVATEALLEDVGTPPALARGAKKPGGPNVLLITFDALSAEDLPVYGYRLPTTPHLAEFARGSSVFNHFYSASTFTTSSIATMLTGLHCTEHGVFHLTGRLRGEHAARTLPRTLHAAGYTTGAVLSNPFAYFLASGLGSDFDYLADPATYTEDLQQWWKALGILHQPQAFGSRSTEYFDLKDIWAFLPRQLEMHDPGRFGRTESGAPPAECFEQATQLLGKMPEGYFLWIHALAPHAPYLPNAAHMGRFLPGGAMRTEVEQQAASRGSIRYKPSAQDKIDQVRLRYDEYLAEADSAFGKFMAATQESGKLDNTAVFVTADHGESFDGGLFQHYTQHMGRPEIHIPLIVKRPGQEKGSKVDVVADQTSLASTVLDVAGVARPKWLRGQSLAPWLDRDQEGAGTGLAFSQFLIRNSIFEPVQTGTAGVIDGRHQYVLDVGTGKGVLRNLPEAHMIGLDRSGDNPAAAARLREAIYSRFPRLPRRSV